ncbi:uncharacterized protein LOC143216783 isoform X1 [Lasioglossum baleicum]|uniref:uncharacterized protein LOC143216783 isoform X1 n=1 Tax=Lasioglossum baleicum TaxID=434251 RepID=UPI003FCDFCA2
MEFSTVKRNRHRRKKRSVKKRRSEQVRFEVKSAKHRRIASEYTDIFVTKEKFTSDTMHADSFWENYTAAQEWQNRHSVTWWRTRCIALEYENQILRDKLRSMAGQNARHHSNYVQKNRKYEDRQVEEETETKSMEDNENLEFHVNEDMMNFLEQSIRHKIELKKKREAESSAEREERDESECIQGGAAWVTARNTNAKLLYGEASPTILAMETALQTTVDRHKDKAKPQLWPIIPLKP